jgi:nucleotide-binding universal stress UspA family protein
MADDCDLIVMASHGSRGLAELMIGSQAQKVVKHSSITFLVGR